MAPNTANTPSINLDHLDSNQQAVDQEQHSPTSTGSVINAPVHLEDLQLTPTAPSTTNSHEEANPTPHLPTAINALAAPQSTNPLREPRPIYKTTAPVMRITPVTLGAGVLTAALVWAFNCPTSIVGIIFSIPGIAITGFGGFAGVIAGGAYGLTQDNKGAAKDMQFIEDKMLRRSKTERNTEPVAVEAIV